LPHGGLANGASFSRLHMANAKITDTRPAFIVPVHNRKEITLGCLRVLRGDGVLEWARVLVIDDGSTDGTADAVASEFPEVELLFGDGTLWWTGAIELGMRRAYDSGAECFIWLNDDTTPLQGSCARLVQTMRETGAIATGQCQIPPDGPVIYGGLVVNGIALRLAPAEGNEPVAVSAACGNFVAVPSSVIRAIGFPDGKRLPHAFGDSDYTLRAKRAGIPIVVDPRARAFAKPNALKNYASWLLSDISVADIWLQMFDKHSYAHAPSYARFQARHFGAKGAAFWAWTVFKRIPITILRLVVPKSLLRRIWGKKSLAWTTDTEVRNALDRSGHPPPATKTGSDE
jgi:GT2 family glycosyltransferase